MICVHWQKAVPELLSLFSLQRWAEGLHVQGFVIKNCHEPCLDDATSKDWEDSKVVENEQVKIEKRTCVFGMQWLIAFFVGEECF